MSCLLNGNDISLTRGDSMLLQINITIKDPETGQLVNYEPESDDVVEFHLKKRWKDKQPLLTKVIPNATLVLELTPEETEQLDYRTYRYDIQITFANGVVNTFITNSPLTITAEIG